jgi:hypothetical protein
MDDAPAPVGRDAAPETFKVGDRVRIEGEVRATNGTGHLIKLDWGGPSQYVWVPFRAIFRVP